MTDDFVHLHTHSDHSQLDGCGKVDTYVGTAVEMGQPGIAFTEHGTMRGFYTLLAETEGKPIKPIYGIEFYVCEDMKRRGVTDAEKEDITKGLKKSEHRKAVTAYEDVHGIRDRWHLTVWAKDNAGLKNLFQLSSKSWIEGFYYKPRIDLKTLMEHREGLMVGTGCLSSPINDRLAGGKRVAALEVADRLRECFGDDLWLEVQPHALPGQVQANEFALELRDRWPGAQLLATQDAHYVHGGDHEHHDVMLCIGTGKNLSDDDRFKFDGTEYWFKNRADMESMFTAHHGAMTPGHLKEALDNTVVLCERVSSKIVIDRFKALLPAVDVPGEFAGNEFEYIKALCKEGWSWREIPERARKFAARKRMTEDEAVAVYSGRLAHELRSIKRQKFVPYFLIVRDLYNWARGNRIACGPGRGSAAGSLISYLLGITALDPIEHGLLFERFISPARVDMPDIDMDFEDVRRSEIIHHLHEKYGRDKVSQIATLGKLTGKQCVKDVSRVLEVPYAEANAITDLIMARAPGDERVHNTIEDSFKGSEELQAFDLKYPAVLRHARILEGMVKNVGIHAAGVVTSPVPLADIVPLETRDHEGQRLVVTAIDMIGCKALGLLKLDVLGLKTMTVVRETVEAVKERHGVELDLERMALDDADTLKGFTEHDFLGVFQYDTGPAHKVCEGVEFTNFEDIATMTALNRPGTARSGLAEMFVARKKDPTMVDDIFHSKVAEITSDTLGVIVYQEHVVRIFQEVAGFSAADADSMRKKIGAREGDEVMEKERAAFLSGVAATTPDMLMDTANDLMDKIVNFGSYGFNKCVTGDTVVVRGGANHHQKAEVTIGELFRAQGSPTPWGKKLRKGKVSILQMEDDGQIRPGKMRTIHFNGTREAWRVKTESGKVITTTGNHRLMTNAGYIEVERLMVGDKLVCMGPRNGYVKKGFAWRGAGKAYEGRADGAGVPIGAANPGWIDGRDGMLSSAKETVQARAGGFCEACCGAFFSVLGKHALEFAHVKSLEGCGGNFRRYHSASNIKHLCNSCHKSLDYSKGERVKRWTRGRSTIVEEVVEIEFVGMRDVFDIEMATPEHNFVANGVVSHNSHASAYGLIGYWCMYLKRRYPLEFFWALMRSESDKIQINRIAKHARRHGVEILPPDVSVSKVGFSIDGPRNAIRGSIVDIKQVGEAAAAAIMANQPYASMSDFLARVNRQKVNKRAVQSLAKAGALESFLPNVKWFLENMESFWERAKGLDDPFNAEMFEGLLRSGAGPGMPVYGEEERMLVAASVNPLGTGRHPLDIYEKFIEANVKVPLANLAEDDFWKKRHDRGWFVAGVVTECKLNQVGDFHTGETPGEAEKARMSWGKRYANLTIEDANGLQLRAKVDWDVYEDFAAVLATDLGAPLVLHVTGDGQYQNSRVHFLVSLEDMRQHIAAGVPLPVWERVLAGNHPINAYPWASADDFLKAAVDIRAELTAAVKKAVAREAKKGVFTVTAVVTHVRQKPDKGGNLMGFFGLLGVKGYLDILCFASNWSGVAHVIAPGNLVQIELERRDKTTFYAGGKLKWLKKSSVAPAARYVTKEEEACPT